MSGLKVEVSILDKLSGHVVQMNNTLTKFTQNTEKQFSSLTKGAMAFGSMVGVGAAVAGIKSFVQAGINYGDTIADMSARTGLSIKAVQELSYVAKTSGTSIENLQMGIKTLSTNAYSNAETFKKLNISTKDLNGNLKSGEEIFYDTILRLSEVENVTERSALATKLFGKSSADVMGIMAQGRDKIEEMIASTRGYGMVLSDDVVKKLNDAKDAQERWNTQISVMTARLTTLALPLIETWLSGVNELIGAQERWQKMKDAKVDPQALALAKEIEAMSLAKTKAEEMGFAIVKVNANGVEWTGTIDEATTVLKDLVAEQNKFLNPATPAAKSTPTITDPSGKAGPKAAFSIPGISQMQIDSVINDTKEKEKEREKKILAEKLNAVTEYYTKLGKVESEGLQSTAAAGQASLDALQYRLDKERQLREESVALGEEFGRAFAQAVIDGKAPLKEALKGTLALFVDFLEKRLLTAIAENAFENFAMLGPIGLLKSAGEAALVNGVFEIAKAKINAFEAGTRSSSAGWATVGERGREVVKLPAGSQVFNAQETRSMGGGHTFNFYDKSGKLIDSLYSEIRAGGPADRFVALLNQKLAAAG